MTHRIQKLAVAACAAFTMALGLGGCKENTIISSNVTPSVDNINTFQVIIPDSFYDAKSVRDDSLLTSSPSSSIYQALGWAKDDIANTSASIYMQVVPKSTGIPFPTGNVIDSAFVILPYAGFTWGDTVNTSTYTINAYQITDTLSITTNYFPFTQKTTGSSIVGTGTFKVGPKVAPSAIGAGVIADSVIVNGTNVAPHLRVKLNTAVINDLKAANDSNTSFAGFISGFRGIYLVADTSGAGKALPYFLVDGTVSDYGGANLLVYAHNGTTDTTYSFPYNATYAARYNRITRNYTDANVFSTPNQLLTMQNAPGASIDFNFKNLDKLTQIPPNSIINRAEIIFTRENNAAIDPYFFGPARIYPQGISSGGVRYTILDRYPTSVTDGLNFIGGTPVDSGNVTKYTLNIPRELQLAITTKQTALHLLIGGTANYPGAYRLRVGSPTNSNIAYRPVVRIIYSNQK